MKRLLLAVLLTWIIAWGSAVVLCMATRQWALVTALIAVAWIGEKIVAYASKD